MSDNNNDELQKRIARLERKVRELEHRLEGKSPRKQTHLEQEEVFRKQESSLSKSLQWGEEWLNRLGIALLLIGLAFLFKYSIEQGWLIPEIRSAIGLLAGTVLLGFGLKMNEGLTLLRQILLGGGVAAFYLTGFATFQLYSFMPAAVVWGFMILVTLLSLWLSLGQDEAVLSVVGTLGALGTPFMLYSGEGEVLSLMLYVVLILSASSIIYILKGWANLLWSMAIGGMLVFFATNIGNLISDTELMYQDRWIIQSGLFFWVITCWLVPVLRGKKWSWKRAPGWSKIPKKEEQISEHSGSQNVIHIMTLGVPVVGLLLSISIEEWTMEQTGIASLGMAAVGGGFYLLLKRWNLSSLASTHAFMGLLMATAGLFLILEGNFLFVVTIIEAMALRYVSYRIRDQKINVASHLLYGFLVLWFFTKLRYGDGVTPFLLNMTDLPELAFILIGGLWIPQYIEDSDFKNIYRLISHLLMLGWLYTELMPFENGQAWVSLSWGLYAIGLWLWGLIHSVKNIHLAGFATLLLVVIKLFLIDLSQLQAIWRILLFMGFGTILLILGYLIQSKWIKEKS